MDWDFWVPNSGALEYVCLREERQGEMVKMATKGYKPVSCASAKDLYASAAVVARL